MREVILDLHNSPELRGSQIRRHGEVVVGRLEGVGARDRSAIHHRRLVLAVGHVASGSHAVVGASLRDHAWRDNSGPVNAAVYQPDS